MAMTAHRPFPEMSADAVIPPTTLFVLMAKTRWVVDVGLWKFSYLCKLDVIYSNGNAEKVVAAKPPKWRHGATVGESDC